MNPLPLIPALWLNFLFHLILISIAFGSLPFLFKEPGKRAFSAALGVVAIGVLPWLTTAFPKSHPISNNSQAAD